MIVYNVTAKIDTQIEREWLLWMKEVHIPEVLHTGCFEAFRILKMIEEDKDGTETYTVQYETNEYALYEKYSIQYSPVLREKTVQKWGENMIAFRTVMEAV